MQALVAIASAVVLIIGGWLLLVALPAWLLIKYGDWMSVRGG